MSADTPPLDTATLQRVGGQIGSNPAGIYQDAAGRRYYVKTLESPAHARNEYIAASLYQLAGAPTLSYVRTKAADQVATAWSELEKNASPISAPTSASRRSNGSACMPGRPTGTPPATTATIRACSTARC